MSDWVNHLHRLPAPRVLLMLSGGKDSIATLITLKNAGVKNLEAIHFIHKWSPEISKLEAVRFCKKYDVPLKIYDFSNDFFAAIRGYTGGRPCLLCKKQMYFSLLRYISECSYDFIAIGDNMNDRTCIARIKKYINMYPEKDACLEFNSYLGAELGIRLPKGVRVLRPLIQMTSEDIEQLLENNKEKVNRLNSTGDKYFEYHREGCYAQFIEPGFPITKELLDISKEYNDLATEYARKKDILASVHVPSTFIITIPKGSEEALGEYLINSGCSINYTVNSTPANPGLKIFRIIIEKKGGQEIYATKSYEKILNRFAERLEICTENKGLLVQNDIIFYSAENLNKKLNVFWDFSREIIDVLIYIPLEDSFVEMNFVENLIQEIFHTRCYNISIV